MSDDSEELDRIKRIEEILTKSFHLARLIRRKGVKSTKIYNENFKLLEENIDRNTKNIDKIVNTLKGLVGDAAEYDKKHPEGNVINMDAERMFL